MTFAPGTRVSPKSIPAHRGTVVAHPDFHDPSVDAEALNWVHVVWDGWFKITPVLGATLTRVKNTLVIIGCTGIRRAFLNLSVEEATRRFLDQENAHVYGDDEKKTQLDSCDRVTTLEFDDEFPTYD